MNDKEQLSEQFTGLISMDIDLDDGWADDVPLVYPENSWKPDDNELTIVEIEPKNSKKKKKKKKQNENLEELIERETTLERKRTIKPFRMFMICWLGLLSIVIAVALGLFYDFLEDYENSYQASRPYHSMDELMTYFDTNNLDVICNMMTSQPVINEYESIINVKNYISSLIEGKQIEYKEASNFSNENPHYVITADGYVIADVVLRKNPEVTLSHNFPTWYISSFDFYTEPPYSVRIEYPENYTPYINGIILNDEYVYEDNIVLEEAEIFGDYAALPTMRKAYITGFYEQPALSAISCFGTECSVVFSDEKNIYEIPFVESEEAYDVQQFAAEAVAQYAMYTSNDTAADALDDYFVPDSEILNLIKMNTSREWFTGHSGAYTDNATVTQFTMFTPEAAHCVIDLEQHMIVYGQDTIIPVHGDFYLVKTQDGWKVCMVMY